MGSGTFYPAVSGDDGSKGEGSVWTGFSYLQLGKPGAIHAFDLWVRFPNVNIPQGSIITSAYIKFTAYVDRDVANCNANVYFNDVDDAAAPTSEAEYNGLAVTSAISWNNIESWTDGSKYNTPELKTILQTIIDRGGWTQGNAVQVLIKDNGSPVYSHRYASAIDYNSGSEKAELHIIWDEIIGYSLVSSGSLDTPAICHHQLLSGTQELISSGIVDISNLLQKHNLVISELLSSSLLDHISIDVLSHLNVAKLVSSVLLDTKDLTQKHSIALQGLLSSGLIDSIVAIQKHLLAVQGIEGIGGIDSVNLTQKHLLAVQEILSFGDLDDSVITQKHILVVQYLLSEGALDALNLIAATLLTVAELISNGALDSKSLAQEHILNIEEVLSAGSVDGIYLTTGQLLIIQKLLSSGIIDNISFSVATGLIYVSLSESLEFQIGLSSFSEFTIPPAAETEYAMALEVGIEYNMVLSESGGISLTKNTEYAIDLAQEGGGE